MYFFKKKINPINVLLITYEYFLNEYLSYRGVGYHVFMYVCPNMLQLFPMQFNFPVWQCWANLIKLVNTVRISILHLKVSNFRLLKNERGAGSAPKLFNTFFVNFCKRGTPPAGETHTESKTTVFQPNVFYKRGDGLN